MSTKLGTLTLDLIAKVGNFVGPVKEAESQVKKSTDNMSKSFDATTLAIGALQGVIAGLSVGALVSYGNQIIQTGAEIQRLATLTNQTAEEFQYFSKGALTAGIDMSGYANILKDVYDRLGEVNRGEGEMMDFFERIAPKVGITAEMFEKLSGQESLQLYYDGLQKANLSQPEMITYMEQIANDASLLIPLLHNGGAGFKQFGDEAKAAGAILSAETIANINQAKESLTVLGYQFEGMQASAINKFVPMLSTVANNMDVIAVASTTAATIIGAKLTWSLSLSAVQWAINTTEVLRYQKALIAMAATSTATSQAMVVARGAGGALLGVLGGPVGLGLTVATVAAGYLVMRDNTEDATAKLAEQAAVASKTTNELMRLQGAQREAAISDLTEALRSQNGELVKINAEYMEAVVNIAKVNTQNKEAQRVYNELRANVLSITDATERLNQTEGVTGEQIKPIVEIAQRYEEARQKAQQSADAQKVLGVEVRLAGNAAENSAGQIRDNASALREAEGAALGAANAMSEYAQKALLAGKQSKIANTLMAKGYSPDVARDLAEIAAKNGKVTRDEAAAILFKNQEQAKLNASVTAYNKLHSASTSRSKERSSAAREEAKVQRELNRTIEDAKRLIYEYGSEFNRIETDLRDEILQIQGAALTSSAKARMIADAQEVSEARKKLYASELDFELNQYRMTEAEKLEAQLNIDKLKIDATKGLLDDERKLKKASLDAQSKIEQSLTRISQDKTLLEIKRHWMTAGEYAREYYALVREEILSTPGYSPEMRDALLSQASAQQNIEESYERDSAIEDYRNVMGYGENPLIEQFEVLQKMRELDLLNEEAYQNAKLELQAKSTASYMEGMLGGFAALVDENSKTYAVLFAAQKAFAVAQAMLNIPAAYSKAFDAVVGTPYIGPYIAPAVGAAAAALQVAQAASMKSVNLTGMAHDGIDNIPKEGTWLLDGGERVLNPEQNKDLTNYLSQAQQNSSGANVNLNPNFVIVDEREKLGDYLFGPDGKKAFVKFFKQNRRELGFA
ncbi:hypothetical protein [Acinetobacter indicus]|uniref:hypothetical protein n=1 Tax=Acinetobacter indicus TaxID=756892 RepID=UPI000CEC1E14|nr:hypothetical protein [Acinetobacter indicus]